MSATPEIYSDSFDIEDAGDIIGLVKTLVNGKHPGILATVDADGKPRLRWMATFSFSEFPVFYTLTHPLSQKVAQIKARPEVSWMFSNTDLSLVVNLTGKARILSDTKSLKRIWGKINDTSHAYFLNQYSTGAGFFVIETTVASIQCSSPKNNLRFDVAANEISR